MRSRKWLWTVSALCLCIAPICSTTLSSTTLWGQPIFVESFDDDNANRRFFDYGLQSALGSFSQDAILAFTFV